MPAPGPSSARLPAGARPPGALAALAGGIALLALTLTPAARAQTRYVAFGDSVTAGVGDPSGQGYPPRLEERLQASDPGATVENAGLPGETTAEGLARIDGVLSGEPGMLLLMEGTNDVSRGISSETGVFNLEAMARKADEAGWDVLHATLIPRLPAGASDRDRQLNGNFNRRLRNNVGERGLDLADPFEVFGSTEDVFARLYSDDSNDLVGHPNAEGYELMADVFRDVLLGVDGVPPVPGLVRPVPGTEGNSPDSVIEVDLWDFGSGVDVLETVLLVDGREVVTQITGSGRRARLVHRPPEPLSGEVVVGLRSRDLASPPNEVDREISRFLIEGAEVVEGDLDGSGRIDGVDLVRFAQRFGALRGDPRYAAAADFDDDGMIDGSDLAVLAANFGRSV